MADEETASNERTPIENLPEADANGVATFPVSLAKAPTSTRPQEAQIFIRMVETGGRAVERAKGLGPPATAAPATALAELVPDVRDLEIYLCGPGPWMTQVKQTLDAVEVPSTSVHAEEFAW